VAGRLGSQEGGHRGVNWVGRRLMSRRAAARGQRVQATHGKRGKGERGMSITR
jgi:hypothetical protein